MAALSFPEVPILNVEQENSFQDTLQWRSYSSGFSYSRSFSYSFRFYSLATIVTLARNRLWMRAVYF